MRENSTHDIQLNGALIADNHWLVYVLMYFLIIDQFFFIFGQLYQIWKYGSLVKIQIKIS